MFDNYDRLMGLADGELRELQGFDREIRNFTVVEPDRLLGDLGKGRLQRVPARFGPRLEPPVEDKAVLPTVFLILVRSFDATPRSFRLAIFGASEKIFSILALSAGSTFISKPPTATSTPSRRRESCPRSV